MLGFSVPIQRMLTYTLFCVLLGLLLLKINPPRNNEQLVKFTAYNVDTRLLNDEVFIEVQLKDKPELAKRIAFVLAHHEVESLIVNGEVFLKAKHLKSKEWARSITHKAQHDDWLKFHGYYGERTD